MSVRRRLGVACLGLFVVTSGAMANDIAPAARSELAPTGKLRVGLNHGNFLLVTPGSSSTDPRGVASDLARELGRRLGVPVEFSRFDTAGALGDAARTGAWDVAFLGAEPQRAAEIAFTAAYLEIPATYLVPAGSPIRSVAEVDREGVRIAVAEKSAYELWLSRNIKHAKLVRGAGNSAGLGLLQAGQADVIAGVRQLLLMDQAKLPGSKVLEDRFMVIEQAMGMPRGRDAGLQYAKEFIEDVKASGFVARSLEKSGVRGVPVAPPEKP
jgi:polar amino acid transport system substrate-binding protein